MAVTINASTSAGLVQTADTSGVLALQTAGTTAVTVDASQNVGIGTSSPTVKLHVSGFVLSGGQNYSARFSDAVNSTYSIAHQSGLTNLITDTAMAFYTANVERMRIDSSGNLQFNSGYGSVATAYGCRAWVNFNGTGTPAIRASGNVSSITDIAAGTYTVNFTTALPDANYSGLITSGFASGVREDILGFAYTDAPYAPTTGGYTVKFVRADTNVNVDTNVAMVAIFR
jgi:hypothetical protein